MCVRFRGYVRNVFRHILLTPLTSGDDLLCTFAVGVQI